MFLSIVGLLLLVNIVVWVLRKLRIGNYGDRYVLITGCDTGFGNMLVKQLDILGFRVFAGCLTETGMDEIRNSCSDRALPIAIDVAKETSIEEAVIQVKRRLPNGKGLWAVVNNAGIIGSLGPTSWQTRQDYIDCMDVNLFGVIFVTKAFLPLVAMEKGRVVNTSSIAGRFALSSSIYSVSKYGVEAFSDCLRREMYRQKVGVHILEPGFFATTLLNPAKLRDSVQKKLDSLPPDIQRTLPQGMREVLLEKASSIAGVSSKDTYLVVDAYIHAISARYPKYRYVVGRDANFIFRLLWTLPESIGDFLFVNYFQ